MRIAEQRVIIGRHCLGEHHGATVVITRHGKTRRHIVAQERDIGIMGTVRERQCTPGLLLFGE